MRTFGILIIIAWTSVSLYLSQPRPDVQYVCIHMYVIRDESVMSFHRGTIGGGWIRELHDRWRRISTGRRIFLSRRRYRYIAAPFRERLSRLLVLSLTWSDLASSNEGRREKRNIGVSQDGTRRDETGRETGNANRGNRAGRRTAIQQ